MSKPGPQPDVSLADVLNAIHDREDDREPVTAGEIAELLECSRRTALTKLNELEAQDRIKGKKVGSRAKVWWPHPGGDLAGDPVLTAPTFASGESEVSGAVDEHLYTDPHDG